MNWPSRNGAPFLPAREAPPLAGGASEPLLPVAGSCERAVRAAADDLQRDRVRNSEIEVARNRRVRRIRWRERERERDSEGEGGEGEGEGEGARLGGEIKIDR